MTYEVFTAYDRSLGHYLAFTTAATDERKNPLNEFFLIGPLPGDSVRSRRLRLTPVSSAVSSSMRDLIDVTRYSRAAMEAMIEEDLIAWHKAHPEQSHSGPVRLAVGGNADVVQCWLRKVWRNSFGYIRTETWDDDLRSFLGELTNLPGIVEVP